MEIEYPRIGVVLGNGPSLSEYDAGGDVVLACNIPTNKYRIDATVITDIEIVWVLKQMPHTITCPVILSTIAWEKMKELHIDDQFRIAHVYKPQDWFTSAHYAAAYLADVVECNKIVIWGCDSYFHDDSKSMTTKYIPRSGSAFYKQWRQSWSELFAARPHIKFDIRVAVLP